MSCKHTSWSPVDLVEALLMSVEYIVIVNGRPRRNLKDDFGV